jgi:hypothetical protein
VLVLAVVIYQAVGAIDGSDHCIKGRLAEHKVAEGRGGIGRTQLAGRRERCALHWSRRDRMRLDAFGNLQVFFDRG